MPNPAPHSPDPESNNAPAMLDPLMAFYRETQTAFPEPTFIDGADMPDPYRSLLAHDNDMTSTLMDYHEDELDLRVLRKVLEGDVLSRMVSLHTRKTRRAVEFGAIQIHLGPFPPSIRWMIEDGRQPLGGILNRHSVVFASSPSGFFHIPADTLLCEALGAEFGQPLYGRCNRLAGRRDVTIAQVVEILPPA